MVSKLIALLRLSRPFFLMGGLVMYALGALVARYEGLPIEWSAYVLGQLVITGLQVMTNCLNEYWDEETDKLNRARTAVSGGSGVLPEGRLSRATALGTGWAGLALACAALVALAGQGRLAPAAWMILLLGFLGSFFYSNLPLRLMSTGYGEITTSILMAGLVPAFAHILQTGQPSWLILVATAPLVVMGYAMILTFEMPDFLSDEATGKRTITVRIGNRNAARLHNALIITALLLAALSRYAGLPNRVALAFIFTAPLALWQVITVRRLQQGDPVAFNRLTFGAVTLFGLTAYFVAFNFWVIG